MFSRGFEFVQPLWKRIKAEFGSGDEKLELSNSGENHDSNGQPFLFECPKYILQEVLKFSDVRTICRFKRVCKRFREKVVTDQLLERIVQFRTNIPVSVLKDDPLRVSQELQRMYWKEPLISSKKNEFWNKFQDTPFPFLEEQKGQFSNMGLTYLGMDSQYVVQCSMFEEIELLNDGLNQAHPAIVRDAETLQVVGFLPGQMGYVALYESKRLGKYALACTMSGNIFATQIESNMIRSVQELAEVRQTKLKRKLLGSMEQSCVHFHKGWLACGLNGKAHLAKLTDEMFDFESEERIQKFTPIEIPTEIVKDVYLDGDLQILAILCDSGRIYVSTDLESLSSYSVLDYTSRLWPDWKHPKEQQRAWLIMKHGMLCILSNAGVILVFKWDGKEFNFWKECTDPTFLKLLNSADVTPESFLTSMDIQAGYLLTQDATGVGFNVWNITSKNDTKMKKFRDLQQRLIPGLDEVTYGIPFWSPSGRKILFSFYPGVLFECKLRQEN
jgi:hypothetical protein